MKKKRQFVALGVLIVQMTALMWQQEVHATSTNVANTQKQIDQKTEEKQQLEGLLDGAKKKLDNFQNIQESFRERLDHLNANMEEIAQKVEGYEQQIKMIEADIRNTQQNMEQAKAEEEKRYACMVARMRIMYERKEDSFLRIFLEKVNPSYSINAADYYQKIVAYDRKSLEELRELRDAIQNYEEWLGRNLERLGFLQDAARAEQNKLQDMIKKTADTIGLYGDQILEEEEKALHFEAEIREKEKDLTYLREKLKQEQELSQKAAKASWRDVSRVSIVEGDRYLLANLIYCEAGAEPYEGQVAVGAVVMNRVRSEVFPDTIEGVIYQNKQFSPVASGRLALALASNKATSSCYRAADEALSGKTNVGDCLFFRTPIPNLTGTQIGGHIFY